MFVLVHKNRVLVGPRDWSRPMFANALKKLKIDHVLPRSQPDTLPWVIDQHTEIMSARVVIPDHNTKTQTYYGPFWTFEDSQAVGTYQIKDKSLDSIRELLTAQATTARYAWETQGIRVTVQDVEVTVDTNRQSRDIFVQKYLLMAPDQTVNWKFPETWLTLTRDQLSQIVEAGAAHIQRTFDWELSMVQQIQAASTIQQLDELVIQTPED